jgi:L-iditol 2-dehydrogenase
VLGHEVAGVIASGPRGGVRVAVDPADPCERCELCLTGRGNLCPDVRFLGFGGTDGGLRTLLAWPGRLLLPLPDSVDTAAAVLLEPLGVAIHALDLGKARAGMSAGVFGCGPIGLLLIQALRAVGCRPIVATDPLAHRRAAAIVLGADVAAEPGSGDLPVVDIAFETAGEDSAIADAVDLVRPGGRVVLGGIPGSDQMVIPASAARRKGLTMLLVRRMAPTDLARALRMVESGLVALAPLITDRYALEHAGSAFERLVDRGGLKVVVESAA